MGQALIISTDRIFGWLGRRILSALAWLADLFAFMLHALGKWRRRGHLRNRATRHALVAQLLFSGVDALPLSLFLSLAVGATLVPPFLLLGSHLGSPSDLADLLVRIIGIELGPLLTAIILIGRTGSAMAVDLANMKLHGEIDSLQQVGVDVGDYFVAPRLLGVSIAQLVIATYFTVLALFGGILLTELFLPIDRAALISGVTSSLHPADAAVFVIKNLLFGLLIAGTACFSALRTGASPTEVPQNTQRAIVQAQLLIFILNGLIAVLML